CPPPAVFVTSRDAPAPLSHLRSIPVGVRPRRVAPAQRPGPLLCPPAAALPQRTASLLPSLAGGPTAEPSSATFDPPVAWFLPRPVCLAARGPPNRCPGPCAGIRKPLLLTAPPALPPTSFALLSSHSVPALILSA